MIEMFFNNGISFTFEKESWWRRGGVGKGKRTREGGLTLSLYMMMCINMHYCFIKGLYAVFLCHC